MSVDPYLKDIARALEEQAKILKVMDGRMKNMVKALEQKQFDEWLPPETDKIYQNMNGCVMMNVVTYKKLIEAYKEKETK